MVDDNMDKKLAKEELIGMKTKIKESTDPTWKGKTGRIIDETKNTFLLETKKRRKMIPKDIAKFEFKKNGKKITLDGIKITYRPEDRIKKVR